MCNNYIKLQAIKNYINFYIDNLFLVLKFFFIFKLILI